MKRQAVAAEKNSGRNNMAAWYRDIGLDEREGRRLLTEATDLGLIGAAAPSSPALSEAIPTRAAAREYAKAEPEVKEIIKATRNNDDTRPLTKWLSGGAKQSDANGSHGFPQGDSGDAFECNVPRPDGSHITAKLFSPSVAWHWILNELTNRSAAVQQRALRLVQVVGATRYSQSSQ